MPIDIMTALSVLVAAACVMRRRAATFRCKVNRPVSPADAVRFREPAAWRALRNTKKENTMKMKKRTVKVGSVWALQAFVAAATAHFAGCPEKAAPWLAAAEYVRPAVEAGERLATLKELRLLPTWALQAVARAAAERPLQSSRYRNIHDGLMTEFERRKAKAAGPAKEGV